MGPPAFFLGLANLLLNTQQQLTRGAFREGELVTCAKRLAHLSSWPQPQEMGVAVTAIS